MRFTLHEASLPPGNTKGDTRYFFPLLKKVEWGEDARTFTLPFQYRLPTETEIEKHGKNSKLQESVLQAALPKIIAAVPDAGLKARLAEIVEQNDEISLLLKRLRHFCRKNTTDYFIHKNLDGFLRRELEFYLKDQVLRLADIDGDLPAKQRTLRVVRQLAEDLIQFLAQIENVQKRLFEKRKFVLKADYLVPIQNVPRELFREIIGNDKQLAAWKDLFALEPKKLNEKFLAEHPTLVVNTAHFDAAFKERLLAAFADLDEATDGLLIRGENYQALRFLETKYAGKVKCFYIDPPYNRGEDRFIYKDRYRHSSWVTMMSERTRLGARLLAKDGAFFSSIDENERDNLLACLDAAFGRENRIEELIWAQNTTHSQSPTYSMNHEYIEVYARDHGIVEQAPAMFREPKPGFVEIMELVERLNPKYASIGEIERELKALMEKHREEYKAELENMGLEWDEETQKTDPWRGIENYCHAEYRDANGKLVAQSKAAEKKANIWVWQEADASVSAQKQAASTRDKDDPNFRFYRPKHPVTGNPCPHPKRGWAWPFRWNDDRVSFIKLDEDSRIYWGENENKVPRLKRFLHEVKTNVAKSVFHDYTDGEKQLTALFGSSATFPNPKPTTLIERLVLQTSSKSDVVGDFFGGSGTTPHAVINANREYNDNRRFLFVEMAGYFDTIALPRVQKVMFASKWKDGEPARLPTKEEAAHSPRLVKVLRLEGYEDALHNLVSDETIDHELPRATAIKEKVGGDTYRLTYMARLPMEASASMLNLAKLEHPFSYTIELLGEDGPRTETVDLVETFNFLYGLHVQRIESWRDEAGKRNYRAVKAKKADGRRVLVLWRDMDKLDPAVERKFVESRLKQDEPFDEAWINGDCAVPLVQSLDSLFKRLLEEEER